MRKNTKNIEGETWGQFLQQFHQLLNTSALGEFKADWLPTLEEEWRFGFSADTALERIETKEGLDT